jgi:hypothetical protein
MFHAIEHRVAQLTLYGRDNGLPESVNIDNCQEKIGFSH